MGTWEVTVKDPRTYRVDGVVVVDAKSALAAVAAVRAQVPDRAYGARKVEGAAHRMAA
jgi:hypothetical protein